MKRILVLGATGSIGTQTLDLIEKYPERFSLYGLTAYHNVGKVHEILRKHKVEVMAILSCYHQEFTAIKIYDVSHIDRLIDELPEDIVIVNALMGSVGLKPTLKAIEKGHDVLLANKETLVVGGELIAPLLKKSKSRLIPIDSEHSALRECLRGHNLLDVDKVVITASGGSFRDLPLEKLTDVSVSDALKHPNWLMGEKITIDSATMMNKVFEVIEAHYLYDLPYDKIEAILHPESMVHALVYYKDGNVLAHMGNPDMHIPILTALEDENRLEYYSEFDITKIRELHFHGMDHVRFPLFKTGLKYAKLKGLYPVTLNAANEKAVELFLKEKIRFTDIEIIIKDCLLHFAGDEAISLDNILRRDEAVRSYINLKYLECG